MIKNRIIQVAHLLFAQNGINAVSMEQIATAAEVPAEIVNAEFGSKTELLDECLKQSAVEIETAIAAAQSLSQSVLETLILVMAVAFKEKSALSHAFHKDLNKYPNTRKHLAIFMLKIQNSCAGYFIKCMEEGYFNTNENQERMALIYMEEICSLATKYQYAMIKTLLKGICTPKGLNEAARIQTVIEIKINKISNLKK